MNSELCFELPGSTEAIHHKEGGVSSTESSSQYENDEDDGMRRKAGHQNSNEAATEGAELGH
ncbi:hypothetical protein MJO28_012129 [Puccinia striiformis f. sp. tritici]|uniref:Uncharacterized protein n=1 Tax=Puccinia striiformis f. sp. tritici TaxID=168172 RepID=A0ACC0DZG5_9BASI|nr:hypothetical protein MJO28_012129 [Puccinia striiformis f. sp. tritici]